MTIQLEAGDFEVSNKELNLINLSDLSEKNIPIANGQDNLGFSNPSIEFSSYSNDSNNQPEKFSNYSNKQKDYFFDLSSIALEERKIFPDFEDIPTLDT